jgi:DNA-directed RNA polymerase specialized sigma24 family protein
MLDDLFTRFHEEIRQLCYEFLATERSRGGAAARGIRADSLCNSLYLRLCTRPQIAKQGKRLFYFVFYSEARRILIDRHRKDSRRNGRMDHLVRVSAVSGFSQVDYSRIEILLENLKKEEPRAALVATLYIFGLPSATTADGNRALKLSDIAERTGYSLRQIEKDWQYARIYIESELDSDQ